MNTYYNATRHARPIDYADYRCNSKANISQYLSIVNRAKRLFVRADGFLTITGPGLDKTKCPFGRLEIAAWNKYMA